MHVAGGEVVALGGGALCFSFGACFGESKRIGLNLLGGQWGCFKEKNGDAVKGEGFGLKEGSSGS